MKVLKSILTFILTLIITCLICLIFVANLLTSTILNKDYVLAKFDETDYYNQIYIYVESNFEKYINQSGLDEEVIKNLITVEQVKNDTEKILANIYDNSQETIDMETTNQKLRNNIQNYLEQNNLNAEQSDIDTFVQTIENEYLTSISHNKYEEKIHDGYLKIVKFANKAKKIAIIAIVLSIILLAVINIKTIYNFVAKIGVSIFASGVFLIFINMYINAKIDVKNLLILNDAISYTLRNLVTDLLRNFLMQGILFTITGLIVIIASVCVHNFLNKDVEEE